jgi:hypothetical protein
MPLASQRTQLAILSSNKCADRGGVFFWMADDRAEDGRRIVTPICATTDLSNGRLALFQIQARLFD